MFTAEQFLAKAAEFTALLTNTARSPNETREFRDLEQTYTTLAENEEWMEVHTDKMIPRRKNYDNRTALAEEEEQILKCLGAAVLMRWNTVPTKLQRELFDCASAIGDLQQTTPLKERIARFLHNLRMTGKNRIRDETTACCTDDTRAFGLKTKQENPVYAVCSHGSSWPILNLTVAGFQSLPRPSPRLSNSQTVAARLGIRAR
jgi:hypothetical protein